MNDHAPNFEIVAGFYFEDGEIGVSGAKLDIAFGLMGKVEILHSKLAVPKGNDDGAVMRLYGLVDNDSVAVEVECIVDIVIGWRWESGFDASMFQLQFSIEQTFLYLNVAHICNA